MVVVVKEIKEETDMDDIDKQGGHDGEGEEGKGRGVREGGGVMVVVVEDKEEKEDEKE